MGATRNVFDFLADTAKPPSVSTCVLFGPELFLKRLALDELRRRLLTSEGQAADVPVTTYDGETANWRDVAGELSTLSLFGGGGRRVVVVDDADPFVTRYREMLEKYAAKTHKSSVLVLVADSWGANTNLYKLVDTSGLQVDCRPPVLPKKGSKTIDEGRVVEWLVGRTQAAHEANLERDAARLLLDLVGLEFGILDQELAKLSVFAGRDGRITLKMVRELAGGWRAKTTWDLVDAAAGGNAAEALAELDQLLQAGQEPIGLMGAIGWALRRFNAATRVVEQAERQGVRMSLPDALAAAGVSRWPEIMDKAERQLKQIGRRRAGSLYRWLLEIDLALKASHSSAPRARWQMERLIVRLSRQLGPQRAT
jgi:DNA polymerase-3 subunit delta